MYSGKEGKGGQSYSRPNVECGSELLDVDDDDDVEVERFRFLRGN